MLRVKLITAPYHKTIALIAALAVLTAWCEPFNAASPSASHLSITGIQLDAYKYYFKHAAEKDTTSGKALPAFN